MTFKNKEDLTEWAYDQFNKFGVKLPETYSEQELIDLNPGVPVYFIKSHIKNGKN